MLEKRSRSLEGKNARNPKAKYWQDHLLSVMTFLKVKVGLVYIHI